MNEPLATSSPTPPFPPAPTAHSSNKRLLVLAGIILVVAGIWFGYETYLKDSFIAEKIDADWSTLGENALLLTLVPTNEEGALSHPRPYFFLTHTRQLVRAPFDTLDTGDVIAVEHSDSPNGAWVTFAVFPHTDDQSPAIQIYRAQVNANADPQTFVEQFKKSVPATHGLDLDKRAPSISNTGAIVYMSQAKAPSRADLELPVENWNITLSSVESEERVLTSGAYPKWLDDSRFVFLKNDGIYLYSLDDESEKKIWELEGATASMMMNVSDSGSLIALSTPKQDTSIILQMLDSSTGKFALKETFPRGGFWPTFSPDGRYLSMILPAKDQIEIDVYDIETSGKRLKTILLGGFDSSRIALTDWVQ